MIDLATPDGRRAAAFLALVGGAMVFTLFAAFGVWTLRNSAGLSFWLALSAHGQVFIALGSLGGLLVKRELELTKDGVKYKDRDDAATGAQLATDAGQQVADELKDAKP